MVVRACSTTDLFILFIIYGYTSYIQEKKFKIYVT
jgi:hypothetical protein